MYGKLQVMKRNGVRGEEINLKEKRITFGRGQNCDILIARKTVSREHACLEIDDCKRVWLINLSEKGHTWVNFDKIKSKDNACEITDGDVIKIADRSFVISLLPIDQRQFVKINRNSANQSRFQCQSQLQSQSQSQSRSKCHSNNNGNNVFDTPIHNDVNMSAITVIDTENQNPNLIDTGNTISGASGVVKINNNNNNTNSKNNGNTKSFFSMSTTPSYGDMFNSNNNNNNSNNNNINDNIGNSTPISPINSYFTFGNSDTGDNDINMGVNNDNNDAITPQTEMALQQSKFANYHSPAPKFTKKKKGGSNARVASNNRNNNDENSENSNENGTYLQARYGNLNSATKDRILALSTADTPAKSALKKTDFENEDGLTDGGRSRKSKKSVRFNAFDTEASIKISPNSHSGSVTQSKKVIPFYLRKQMIKNNLSQEAKSLLTENLLNDDTGDDNNGDRLKLSDSIAGGRVKNVRRRSFVNEDGNIVTGNETENDNNNDDNDDDNGDINVSKSCYKPFGLPQPLMQTPLGKAKEFRKNDKKKSIAMHKQELGINKKDIIDNARINANAVQHQRPFVGSRYVGTPRPKFHPTQNGDFGATSNILGMSGSDIDHCDHLLNAVNAIRSTPHKMASLSKQKKSAIHSLHENLTKLKECAIATTKVEKNDNNNDNNNISIGDSGRISMRYIHTSTNDANNGNGNGMVMNSPQLLKALVADFTNLIESSNNDKNENDKSETTEKEKETKSSKSGKMEIEDDSNDNDAQDNNNNGKETSIQVVEPILQALNDIPLLDHNNNNSGNGVASTPTPQCEGCDGIVKQRSLLDAIVALARQGKDANTFAPIAGVSSDASNDASNEKNNKEDNNGSMFLEESISKTLATPMKKFVFSSNGNNDASDNENEDRFMKRSFTPESDLNNARQCCKRMFQELARIFKIEETKIPELAAKKMYQGLRSLLLLSLEANAKQEQAQESQQGENGARNSNGLSLVAENSVSVESRSSAWSNSSSCSSGDDEEYEDDGDDNMGENEEEQEEEKARNSILDEAVNYVTNFFGGNGSSRSSSSNSSNSSNGGNGADGGGASMARNGSQRRRRRISSHRMQPNRKHRKHSMSYNIVSDSNSDSVDIDDMLCGLKNGRFLISNERLIEIMKLFNIKPPCATSCENSNENGVTMTIDNIIIDSRTIEMIASALAQSLKEGLLELYSNPESMVYLSPESRNTAISCLCEMVTAPQKKLTQILGKTPKSIKSPLSVLDGLCQLVKTPGNNNHNNIHACTNISSSSEVSNTVALSDVNSNSNSNMGSNDNNMGSMYVGAKKTNKIDADKSGSSASSGSDASGGSWDKTPTSDNGAIGSNENTKIGRNKLSFDNIDDNENENDNEIDNDDCMSSNNKNVNNGSLCVNKSRISERSNSNNTNVNNGSAIKMSNDNSNDNDKDNDNGGFFGGFKGLGTFGSFMDVNDESIVESNMNDTSRISSNSVVHAIPVNESMNSSSIKNINDRSSIMNSETKDVANDNDINMDATEIDENSEDNNDASNMNNTRNGLNLSNLEDGSSNQNTLTVGENTNCLMKDLLQQFSHKSNSNIDMNTSFEQIEFNGTPDTSLLNSNSNDKSNNNDNNNNNNEKKNDGATNFGRFMSDELAFELQESPIEKVQNNNKKNVRSCSNTSQVTAMSDLSESSNNSNVRSDAPAADNTAHRKKRRFSDVDNVAENPRVNKFHKIAAGVDNYQQQEQEEKPNASPQRRIRATTGMTIMAPQQAKNNGAIATTTTTEEDAEMMDKTVKITAVVAQSGGGGGGGGSSGVAPSAIVVSGLNDNNTKNNNNNINEKTPIAGENKGSIIKATAPSTTESNINAGGMKFDLDWIHSNEKMKKKEKRTTTTTTASDNDHSMGNDLQLNEPERSSSVRTNSGQKLRLSQALTSCNDLCMANLNSSMQSNKSNNGNNLGVPDSPGTDIVTPLSQTYSNANEFEWFVDGDMDDSSLNGDGNKRAGVKQVKGGKNDDNSSNNKQDDEKRKGLKMKGEKGKNGKNERLNAIQSARILKMQSNKQRRLSHVTPRESPRKTDRRKQRMRAYSMIYSNNDNEDDQYEDDGNDDDNTMNGQNDDDAGDDGYDGKTTKITAPVTTGVNIMRRERKLDRKKHENDKECGNDDATTTDDHVASKHHAMPQTAFVKKSKNIFNTKDDNNNNEDGNEEDLTVVNGQNDNMNDDDDDDGANINGNEFDGDLDLSNMFEDAASSTVHSPETTKSRDDIRKSDKGHKLEKIFRTRPRTVGRPSKLSQGELTKSDQCLLDMNASNDNSVDAMNVVYSHVANTQSPSKRKLRNKKLQARAATVQKAKRSLKKGVNINKVFKFGNVNRENKNNEREDGNSKKKGASSLGKGQKSKNKRGSYTVGGPINRFSSRVGNNGGIFGDFAFGASNNNNNNSNNNGDNNNVDGNNMDSLGSIEEHHNELNASQFSNGICSKDDKIDYRSIVGENDQESNDVASKLNTLQSLMSHPQSKRKSKSHSRLNQSIHSILDESNIIDETAEMDDNEDNVMIDNEDENEHENGNRQGNNDDNNNINEANNGNENENENENDKHNDNDNDVASRSSSVASSVPQIMQLFGKDSKLLDEKEDDDSNDSDFVIHTSDEEDSSAEYESSDDVTYDDISQKLLNDEDVKDCHKRIDFRSSMDDLNDAMECLSYNNDENDLANENEFSNLNSNSNDNNNVNKNWSKAMLEEKGTGSSVMSENTKEVVTKGFSSISIETSPKDENDENDKPSLTRQGTIFNKSNNSNDSNSSNNRRLRKRKFGQTTISQDRQEDDEPPSKKSRTDGNKKRQSETQNQNENENENENDNENKNNIDVELEESTPTENRNGTENENENENDDKNEKSKLKSKKPLLQLKPSETQRLIEYKGLTDEALIEFAAKNNDRPTMHDATPQVFKGKSGKIRFKNINELLYSTGSNAKSVVSDSSIIEENENDNENNTNDNNNSKIKESSNNDNDGMITQELLKVQEKEKEDENENEKDFGIETMGNNDLSMIEECSGNEGNNNNNNNNENNNENNNDSENEDDDINGMKTNLILDLSNIAEEPESKLLSNEDKNKTKEQADIDINMDADVDGARGNENKNENNDNSGQNKGDVVEEEEEEEDDDIDIDLVKNKSKESSQENERNELKSKTDSNDNSNENTNDNSNDNTKGVKTKKKKGKVFRVGGVPITGLRVVDLKAELKKRRLTIYGRKHELIDRLQQALESESQSQSETQSQSQSQSKTTSRDTSIDNDRISRRTSVNTRSSINTNVTDTASIKDRKSRSMTTDNKSSVSKRGRKPNASKGIVTKTKSKLKSHSKPPRASTQVNTIEKSKMKTKSALTRENVNIKSKTTTNTNNNTNKKNKSVRGRSRGRPKSKTKASLKDDNSEESNEKSEIDSNKNNKSPTHRRRRKKSLRAISNELSDNDIDIENENENENEKSNSNSNSNSNGGNDKESENENGESKSKEKTVETAKTTTDKRRSGIRRSARIRNKRLRRDD